MQALIQMLAGFIAMLAAAALSQFGVNLDVPHKPQREIHRIRDCQEPPAARMLAATTDKDQC